MNLMSFVVGYTGVNKKLLKDWKDVYYVAQK